MCVVLRLRFDLTREISAASVAEMEVFILSRFFWKTDFFACDIYRCYFLRRPETGRLNCVCD